MPDASLAGVVDRLHQKVIYKLMVLEVRDHQAVRKICAASAYSLILSEFRGEALLFTGEAGAAARPVFRHVFLGTFTWSSCNHKI